MRAKRGDESAESKAWVKRGLELPRVQTPLSLGVKTHQLSATHRLLPAAQILPEMFSSLTRI